MSIKLNLGVNKKIGQPNYGSRGASCHVEFELDGGFDHGAAARFHEVARRAYAACRQAVESELVADDSNTLPPENQDGTTGQHVSPPVAIGQRAPADPAANAVRMATESQIRAIQAIAERKRVELPPLLRSEFGVERSDELSLMNASRLIDLLQASAGNGVCP